MKLSETVDPPPGAGQRDVAAADPDRPRVLQPAQPARVPAHRRAAGQRRARG